MRIVGGKFKGRRLATPNSKAIRPTSDRTRESLFNMLANRHDLQDARVLDLFAGTGALGLEAVSRGAAFVLFVENSTQGRALIRANAEALGLQGKTRLFRRDATRLGDAGKISQFDLAFADPPYARGLGESAAKALLAGRWLKAGALFILEENSSDFPDSIDGFVLEDRRDYGDTAIGFFRENSKD
ncbi:MAG: 16S rRNA (guanine(966)-N(2))-methyltransferase RsmD [Pseudomonadota bacterium]